MAVDERVVESVEFLLRHTPSETELKMAAVVEAVDRVVRIALAPEQLRVYESFLRPLVKALTSLSAFLPQTRWDAVLAALEGIANLRSGALPWTQRGFVLKCLPEMASAPDEESDPIAEARALSVCATLVRCALPRPEDAVEETQVQRVAQTSLLSLPHYVGQRMVVHLTDALPNSLNTCVALIANPSAYKEFHRAMEDHIVSRRMCQGDDASLKTIQEVLQKYYAGYGGATVEHLCKNLGSCPTMESLEAAAAFLDTVVRPLVALTRAKGVARHTMEQHISVLCLLDQLVALWVLWAPLQEGNRADMVLELARGLVDLSPFVTAAPRAEDAVPLTRLQNVLTSLEGCTRNADKLLDLPMPLVECVLLLLYRFVTPTGVMLDTDTSVTEEPAPDSCTAATVGTLKDRHSFIVYCDNFLQLHMLAVVEEVTCRLECALAERRKKGCDLRASATPIPSGVVSRRASECDGATSNPDGGVSSKSVTTVDEMRSQLSVLCSVCTLMSLIHQAVRSPQKHSKQLTTVTPSWVSREVHSNRTEWGSMDPATVHTVGSHKRHDGTNRDYRGGRSSGRKRHR